MSAVRTDPHALVDEIPEIQELDEWRARARRCRPGDRLPLLTPEQAAAWTGEDAQVLMGKVTHFQERRLVRFFPEQILAYLKPLPPPADVVLPEPLHDLEGTVYIIEAVGADRVKIGFTGDTPERRRRQLQTSAPFELRILVALPGSIDLEQRLHVEHQRERILPTAEWFHLRGRVAELVDYARSTGRWP